MEEEYFISGTAAAYRHGVSGPEAISARLPYTTRIVVRRPSDPARFSGVVHFEPIHPSGGVTFSWLAMDLYIMSRGDIYVAVGLGDADAGHSGSPKYPNQTAPVGAHKVARWFDPERYAALEWPAEEGIRWEVMSDIGRKLRSGDPDSPLRGLDVRAVIVSGWSYTGSLQRTFINEGFHDRARLPDGKPVFDGYLIGVSSQWNRPGYLPLHNDEEFVPIGDPRRDLRVTDAKVIEFLTEAEVELGAGASPPERDGPLGGYRLYELGGVIHVASLVDPSIPFSEEPALTQLARRGYPKEMIPNDPVFRCSLPQSDVPHGAFVRAAVENLRVWILEGQVPPHAKPLAWDDGKLARDVTGNPVGGIRPAEFEVPLAHYGRYTGSALANCSDERQYPFVFFLRNELSPDELVRRYGTPEHFLTAYGQEVDRLVKQRWLLPEDGLRLKANALEDAARQFGRSVDSWALPGG
ncbi:hypothetical protein ASD76_09505 [Altererythrobacter sp. Root672]|nr:hypothetical protein ASD76_09505 [Altererythrobacter sp. Root672]